MKYEITEGGNELIKRVEDKHYLIKKNRIIKRDRVDFVGKSYFAVCLTLKMGTGKTKNKLSKITE